MLQGIRIVEIGQYIPSPYAALMLADLGAEVVKIEPPRGDPMRHIGVVSKDGASASYAAMNGGKRVVRVDLKDKNGQKAVQDLVEKADVLIESMRPGVLDRLGLGRDLLQRINPRLIHCAISGFGQNGPLRLRPGHDLNYMAAGGGLGLSGTLERPVMARPPVSDYASALQAALTISAALFQRSRTGRGAYIDISMAEVVLAWQAPLLSEALANSSVRRAEDADSGGLASYNIYRTSEGRYVTLGAEEPHFWERFCTAVERPEWIERGSEPAPQMSLIRDLADLFASRDAAHWDSLLAEGDCCFQIVLEPNEVLAFEQFAERKMIRRSDWGAVDVLYPAWIDGAPPEPREPFVELPEAALGTIWA
ncbi:CaiB/BaiF CoA transferase family protein [Mesorhizobium retamae]|uniref:CoA transferase n=1 Tax=Mesorhizobium retamae TaxID=2912854 RepID=A0ABS9QD87_9HYPH|nr:CoA transferase [Mesorhizobium sp. IRAMC:0171]MCG7505384.1 CoA transferase [Mesorhizobium sp. IRAMC:0171]